MSAQALGTAGLLDVAAIPVQQDVGLVYVLVSGCYSIDQANPGMPPHPVCYSVIVEEGEALKAI